jgi:chromosomal replication initiator protein
VSAALWNRCLLRLEEEIDDRELATWIRPLRAISDGQRLLLLAPNPVVQSKVSELFLPIIQRVLSETLGEPQLVVEIGVSGNREHVAEPAPVPSSNEEPAAQVRVSGRVDGRYTFESFIEGKSNAQARAAAQQVAEAPGARFNPLLIYGESGLGKTHLMHAIGNNIAAQKTGARVLYVGAEKFVRDLVTSIRGSTTETFKEHYRSVDALLIDDIHFFVGKSGSQEEFFHTFNELLDGRQQMVMTCDRYPAELDGLDTRLKSRFTWGLTVPVEPPELETRVAILLSKAENSGVTLAENVAFFVAQRVRSNVRELEGALNRLMASSRFLGREITEDFARETLNDIFSSYERLVTMDNIKRVVALYYKIRVADITSVRRTRSVARPRQIAMALCKELTQHSLPEIGDSFGKDHTTVLHACRKVKELRAGDVRIREDWDNLIRQLGG